MHESGLQRACKLFRVDAVNEKNSFQVFVGGALHQTPSQRARRCCDPISIRPPAENTASNIQLLRGEVRGAPRLFIHGAAWENLRRARRQRLPHV